MALRYESRCLGPVRKRVVTLTHSFEISRTEVTCEQFEQVIGSRPKCTFADPSSCAGDRPVVYVSRGNAAAYCNTLSDRAGLPACYSCGRDACTTSPAYPGAGIYDCPGYRLATSAEWEYAYRAGTDSDIYNGALLTCEGQDQNADEIAWYAQNSAGVPQAVATKLPNPWGIYDMAGNAAELIHDLENPTTKEEESTQPVTDPWGDTPYSCCDSVVRGGSFNQGPEMLQAASRMRLGGLYASVGFRPVRTVVP